MKDDDDEQSDEIVCYTESQADDHAAPISTSLFTQRYKGEKDSPMEDHTELQHGHTDQLGCRLGATRFVKHTMGIFLFEIILLECGRGRGMTGIVTVFRGGLYGKGMGSRCGVVAMGMGVGGVFVVVGGYEVERTEIL